MCEMGMGRDQKRKLRNMKAGGGKGRARIPEIFRGDGEREVLRERKKGILKWPLRGIFNIYI